MTPLPLYADPVERWAIASTGQPLVAVRGYSKGQVVQLPDGTFLYQRRGKRGRPAVSEPVEIRRFFRVVSAVIHGTNDDARVRTFGRLLTELS